MRSERRISWLRDIVNNCDRIGRHIAGSSRDDFAKDEKTNDAVERCLERICEAAKRLKDDERTSKVDRSLDQIYPDVPWSDVRGMGNVLRHDYEIIDIDLVWKTICKRLPVIRDAAARELERLK